MLEFHLTPYALCDIFDIALSPLRNAAVARQFSVDATKLQSRQRAAQWNTVVSDWESTKPHLCSKLSLFKMSWQMLKVPLQLSPLATSLPYLRTFQWGTVRPCILRGIKSTTHQNRHRLILLDKSWTVNFSLLYFLYPMKYRAIHYLIGKVSDMVKMSQKGSIVTALLASVRASWKVTIYYINATLLILNQQPL